MNKKIITTWISLLFMLSLASCELSEKSEWNKKMEENNESKIEQVVEKNIQKAMPEAPKEVKKVAIETAKQVAWITWDFIQEVTYWSPAWNANFSVSLENWVIKSANVESIKVSAASQKNIDNFNSAVSSELVWKNISALSWISAVWWASLATVEFKKIVNNLK